MKEEKFTKILGEIDEKYVNEVMEESKPRRFVPFKKWAALAACFCIIAISATVVVAEVFDIKFIGNGIDFSSRHKTNYYFKVEIEEEYLSEDVFGKRFAEAKEGLAKSVDWAAGCPDCKKNAPNACEFHISHGTWRKAFREGPKEALDIIGYEEIIYPEFDYEHLELLKEDIQSENKLFLPPVHMYTEIADTKNPDTSIQEEFAYLKENGVSATELAACTYYMRSWIDGGEEYMKVWVLLAKENDKIYVVLFET